MVEIAGCKGTAAGARLTQGQTAERLVADRLRAALKPDYRLFTNVARLGRTAEHRGLRDGEADIVLAHPDKGFLVFEVKSGEVARGRHGPVLDLC